MDHNNTHSFSYTGFWGGKKEVPALGAFMLFAFGIPLLFIEFFTAVPIQPAWTLWFFRVGTALGVLFLLGGAFAKDVEEAEEQHETQKTSWPESSSEQS